MSVSILKSDLLLRMPLNGSASNTMLVELENYASLWLYGEYTADADTASTLGIKFSVDPNSTPVTPIPLVITPAAGSYSPLYSNIPALTSSAFDFTGRTAAGSFYAYFEQPPPFLRLVYTRSAGSRQFLFTVFGRSG